MRVLVTGGMGFIGNSVVNGLLEMEHEVIAIGRSKNPPNAKMLPNLQYHSIDLSLGKIPDEIIRGTELVFHIAAKAGIGGKYSDYYAANYLATVQLLETCKAQGVPRFVFTSSPSVAFSNNSISNGNESLPYLNQPDFAYAHTKALAEKQVLLAHQPASFQTLALRPHLVWGVGDPHLLPRVIKRHKAGKLRIVGEGQNLVDLTHIKNVTHAHILAMKKMLTDDHFGGNPYFIGQDEPVSLWDWVNEIFLALKLPPLDAKVSFRKAYLAGGLMEHIWKLPLFSGDPPMTRFVASQLAHDHWFSNERAFSDLGYSPILSMKEAMKETLPWLKTL
ncbi:MAG: NAD-dependent epimerase/dehydratase family protein [Opitutales bacterium]